MTTTSFGHMIQSSLYFWKMILHLVILSKKVLQPLPPTRLFCLQILSFQLTKTNWFSIILEIRLSLPNHLTLKQQVISTSLIPRSYNTSWFIAKSNSLLYPQKTDLLLNIFRPIPDNVCHNFKNDQMFTPNQLVPYNYFPL